MHTDLVQDLTVAVTELFSDHVALSHATWIRAVVEHGRQFLQSESCSLLTIERPVIRVEVTCSERSGTQLGNVVIPFNPERGGGLTSYIAAQLLTGAQTVLLNGTSLQKHPHNNGSTSTFLKAVNHSLLAVPINTDDASTFRLLKFHNKTNDSHAFSKHDEALALLYSSLVSMSRRRLYAGIDNADLLRELADAFQQSPLSTNPYDRMLKLAARITDSDQAYYWQAQHEDTDSGEILGMFSLPGLPTLAPTFTTSDTRAGVVDEAGCQRLSVPVGLHGSLGFLMLIKHGTGRPLQRSDTINALTACLATKRVHTDAERQMLREADALYACLSSDPTLRAFLQSLPAIVQATGAMLYIPDYHHETLRLAGLFPEPQSGAGITSDFGYSFQERPSLAAEVWRTGQCLHVRNWMDSDVVNRDAAATFNISGELLGVPLKQKNGSFEDVIGVLVVWGPRLDEEAKTRLNAVCGFAAPALTRSAWGIRRQQSIRTLSDLLTNVTSDSLASPQLRRRMIASIRDAGFKRVRYFTFDSHRRKLICRDSVGMSPEYVNKRVELDCDRNPYVKDTMARIRLDSSPIIYDPSTSPWGDDPDAIALEKDSSIPWVVIPLYDASGPSGILTADLQPSAITSQAMVRELESQLDFLVIAGSIMSTVAQKHAARVQLTGDNRLIRKALDAARGPIHNVVGIATQLASSHQTERFGELTRYLSLESTLLHRFLRMAEALLDERQRPAATADPEFVDIGGVLKDRVAAIEPEAKAELVRLVLIPTPMAIEVLCDSRDLALALDMLLDNALRFSSPGQRIELSAVRDEDEVHIHVRDQGPGIPPHLRDRIFEPFVSIPRTGGRTRSSSITRADAPWPGVGLYLARNVLQRHGGRLTARNREDSLGADFCLTLPLASFSNT